jgi:hypothetical protein
MINTLLVLVSLSVYTFSVLKSNVFQEGHCIDEHTGKERLSLG